MKLERLASNLHAVNIGKLKLYYSHETVIAFRRGDKLTISRNVWSKTTGKHLNILSEDKEERLGHEVFLKRLQNVLELYGVNKQMSSL